MTSKINGHEREEMKTGFVENSVNRNKSETFFFFENPVW